MATRIPTQDEYEAREARTLQTQLARVEDAPLADRKAGAAEWADMLKDADLIGERCTWLLEGAYGFGACQRAKNIQSNRHLNRAASLCILLAALDCNCPARMAIKAYKAISLKAQVRITSIVVLALETTQPAI